MIPLEKSGVISFGWVQTRLRVPVHFLEGEKSKMDATLSERQGYSLMELAGPPLLTRARHQAAVRWWREGKDRP